MIMVPFKQLLYETCWQVMHCPQDMRVQCIAYKTNMKEPCWVLNGGKGHSVLGTCTHCPWFLKNNPDLHD